MVFWSVYSVVSMFHQIKWVLVRGRVLWSKNWQWRWLFLFELFIGTLLPVNEICVFDTWPDHMSVWVTVGSLQSHQTRAKEGEGLARCSVECKRKTGQVLKCSSCWDTRGLTLCVVYQDNQRQTYTCIVPHMHASPWGGRWRKGREIWGWRGMYSCNNSSSLRTPIHVWRCFCLPSVSLSCLWVCLFVCFKASGVPSARVRITTAITCHMFTNTHL